MTKRFQTIVIDPPWPMPETGARTDSGKVGTYEAKGGRTVQAEWWGSKTGKTVKLPYETMTIPEITALPVDELADKNAHMYLWTTNKFLEAALLIVRAWGFKTSQILTWCKPPMGIGFGGTFCSTTEFVLFCRRGILPAKQRIDSTWWKWSRPYENGHIAHSAKPEAFIDMVEQVSPAPYLEMFARRNRLGWSTWGNECLEHVALHLSNSDSDTSGRETQ